MVFGKKTSVSTETSNKQDTATFTASADLPAEPVIDYSKATPDLDLSTLTKHSLGVHQNESGDWIVSVLKYNPETGQAAVVQQINEGTDRGFAIERFKILSIKLEII